MSQGVGSVKAGHGDSDGGFSLLETLTALTILAIALVSLFEAQATGLQTAGAADQYGKARILAHSRLVLTTSGEGPPHSEAGRDGIFSWSVNVSRANQSWAEMSSEQNWRLYQISVSVSWGKGRHIKLQSLKLARSPDEDRP